VIELSVDARFRAGWAGGSPLIPHDTLGVLQSFVETVRLRPLPRPLAGRLSKQAR